MRNAAVRKTYQAYTAPQMRNDPHLSPQLILGMEWYCIPPRNYYKSAAAFTFLNRISTVLALVSSNRLCDLCV